MKRWMTRTLTVAILCLLALQVRAQDWTPRDSIRLKKMLESDGEIKINTDVLKQIDLGGGGVAGTPQISDEKSWMKYDETLPDPISKPKMVLTLRPYQANTPYNWDPVYQKKIRVTKNTWRSDPLYEVKSQRSYSNWASSPFAAGVRKTLDEIRASGVRYNLIGERANGVLVNSTTVTQGIPLFGKSGIYINGSTIGGLDLMTPFTKDFWSWKENKRRARTLEVLRTYGDSTTVMINHPIEQILP